MSVTIYIALIWYKYSKRKVHTLGTKLTQGTLICVTGYSIFMIINCTSYIYSAAADSKKSECNCQIIKSWFIFMHAQYIQQLGTWISLYIVVNIPFLSFTFIDSKRNSNLQIYIKVLLNIIFLMIHVTC